MTPFAVSKTGGNRVASLFCLLIPILVGFALRAHADVDSIESDAEKWIELQTRIAEENAKWKIEKELLESSILVLTTEQESLKESLESNKVASDLYEKNRNRVVSKLKENGDALQHLMGKMEEYESQINSIYAGLPEPLQKEVESMMRKIPAMIDDEPLSVAARIQSLISVLTSIDQFNNALNLTHQLRKNSDGTQIDVRVLYWGLSVGYAVDGRGNQAWVLKPGESGWTWNEANDMTSDIQDLMDVYEKRGSPRLISLPASLN